MLRLSLRAGLVVTLAACNTSNGPSRDARTTPPTSTLGASAPRAGYAGEKKLVVRSTLRFETPAAGAKYDTLLACFVRDEPGFYAYPMRRIGGSVAVEWCRGKGAHINCAGGETRKSPGAAWTDLRTYHYPQSWPEVFGLGFTVGEIPDGGIGAAVAWSQGGKRYIGDHASFTFYAVDAGQIAQRFELGMSDAMTFGETTIATAMEGTRAEFMQRVRKSPASLRAEIEKRMTDLESVVADALDAGRPRKCVYGEYAGDGVPPPCVDRVPLDAAELITARAALTKYVNGFRTMAVEHAPAMHAKVFELLPSRCWTS